MSELEELIRNTPPLKLERVFFTVEQLRAIPQQKLKEFGLLPQYPSPVDIDAFAEKIAKVEYRYDLPADTQGVTLFTPFGIPSIYLSATLEEDSTLYGNRKFRFLTAHEAAHALVHDPLFKAACSQMNILQYGYACYAGTPFYTRLDGIKDYSRYQWIEYQANAIAAGLLMPWRHLMGVYAYVIEEAQRQRRMGNPYEKVRAELPSFFENCVQDTFNVSTSVAHIEVRDFLRARTEEIERLLR